ncbi:hypothetical protein C365_00866 [Cryptococcus neoformans Bt85]|nr:hypothetical protein C365_00866 [Cryptococcus neoformans var. grubii Bt85]
MLAEFKHRYTPLLISIISKFERHDSTSSFLTPHPAIFNQHSWKFVKTFPIKEKSELFPFFHGLYGVLYIQSQNPRMMVDDGEH